MQHLYDLPGAWKVESDLRRKEAARLVAVRRAAAAVVASAFVAAAIVPAAVAHSAPVRHVTVHVQAHVQRLHITPGGIKEYKQVLPCPGGIKEY
jgi:hypothetical protein